LLTVEYFLLITDSQNGFIYSVVFCCMKLDF